MLFNLGYQSHRDTLGYAITIFDYYEGKKLYEKKNFKRNKDREREKKKLVTQVRVA